jgi:hypothetical protein
MRYLRMTGGLAAVVCAFAVMTAPALAHEFVASRLPKPITEAEPGRTKGIGIGNPFEGTTLENPAFEKVTQEFKFGAFLIVCNKALAKAKTTAEGAVGFASSPIFASEVKFAECGDAVKLGSSYARLKTTFNGGLPIKFAWHANGYAEFGSEETVSEVEIGGGTTTFSVGGGICKIGWPAQTVPVRAVKKPAEQYSSAVYSNTEVPVLETQLKKFPTGFQKRLIIANEFKGMKYIYEEGQCKGEGGFEQEFKGAEGNSGFYKGTLEEEVVGGNLSFQ